MKKLENRRKREKKTSSRNNARNGRDCTTQSHDYSSQGLLVLLALCYIILYQLTRISFCPRLRHSGQDVLVSPPLCLVELVHGHECLQSAIREHLVASFDVSPLGQGPTETRQVSRIQHEGISVPRKRLRRFRFNFFAYSGISGEGGEKLVRIYVARMM